jgi:hypothetical protein
MATDTRGSLTPGVPERGWPVVQVILEQSEGPLTRRAIRQRWPDAVLAPAKHTSWKWLGRAVQEGRVLRDGRGTRREPFLYQLPGMAEKWQQNFLASFLKRLEQDEKGKGPPGLETPRCGDDTGTATVLPAVAGEAPRCLDPVPAAEPIPQTAAPELPRPDPLPSQASEPAEPPPPEAGVRLPYPYNMMNPADVPEEVWRRAREAQNG